MDKTQNGLSRTDRDLLISVSTKQDLMAVDIKDIKTDLLGRIIKTESRLDAMDVYHAAIPLKDYEEKAAWVGTFRSNIKFMMVASALLFGSIGAVIVKIIEIAFKIK